MRELAKIPKFVAAVLISWVFTLGYCLADVRISEDSFRALAKKLAPKVNLFADIWQNDPGAIFYGGTSRDFLYWILRKTRGAQTELELQQKIEALKKLEIIDIKEFLGGESDVDVVTSRGNFPDAALYGVRKIDPIDPARLDTHTSKGLSELNQGYIPLEKIELAQEGVRAPQAFGDGLKEMLTDDLSFHPTTGETFWQTDFAKQGLNHPVFLAIRYLRIRAAHYYSTRGDGLPDLEELLRMDPKTAESLHALIKNAQTDPKFVQVIKNEKALEWLNGSILKTFRSYTNMTAAYELLKHFGFLSLQGLFPKITSINQFLFWKRRDARMIEANIKKYSKPPEGIFTPADIALEDLTLLHGTPEDMRLRAIVFQNAIPSDRGMAGVGLYGVDLPHKAAAVKRAQNDENRIALFTVSRDAKVIDITQGEGLRVFKQWTKEHGTHYELFADAFGADILKYEYKLDGVPIDGAPYAFVVKNSEVLIARRGLTRKFLTTPEAIDLADSVDSAQKYQELIKTLSLNLFSQRELNLCLSHIPKDKQIEWLQKIIDTPDATTPLHYLPRLLSGIPSPERMGFLRKIFSTETLSWNSQMAILALDAVFIHIGATESEKNEITSFLLGLQNTALRLALSFKIVFPEKREVSESLRGEVFNYYDTTTVDKWMVDLASRLDPPSEIVQHFEWAGVLLSHKELKAPTIIPLYNHWLTVLLKNPSISESTRNAAKRMVRKTFFAPEAYGRELRFAMGEAYLSERISAFTQTCILRLKRLIR